LQNSGANWYLNRPSRRSASAGKGANSRKPSAARAALTTKIHALLDLLPTTTLQHGDTGYDSDAVRRKVEAMGAAPNIPQNPPTLEALLLTRSLSCAKRHRTLVQCSID
jgi:hypothetical protein